MFNIFYQTVILLLETFMKTYQVVVILENKYEYSKGFNLKLNGKIRN